MLMVAGQETQTTGERNLMARTSFSRFTNFVVSLRVFSAHDAAAGHLRFDGLGPEAERQLHQANLRFGRRR